MIKYSKLGVREDLEIIGIGDASHRSCWGDLVLIVNAKKNKAVAIMWKIKQNQGWDILANMQKH